MRAMPRAAALALTVLHWLLMYVLNVHVYFTDSIAVLNAIVVIDLVVALQWYHVGGCILTPVENQLVTSAATDNHFLVAGLSRLTGVPTGVLSFSLSMMPLVSTCVALLRLRGLRGVSGRRREL